MNIQAILNLAKENPGWVLVILFSLIQIAPIKVNPWSWVLKVLKPALVAIGNACNRDTIDKVEKLCVEVAGVKKEVASVKQDVKDARDASDKEAAVSARVRILRFGDDMARGVHHSKDHYDQTLSDVDEYEHYCETHPDFKNSITVTTVASIKADYAEKIKTNGFLKKGE